MKKTLLTAAACLCAALAAAQTPAELRSWLPPMAGWTIDENIEVFNPDNLFNRINGAAPLYLENNFREMTSMEYKRGEEYITIQAYRHASPADAFGMYSAERSPDLEYFSFGGEAQGDASNVFFYAGSIYVKMWAYAADDVSETLQAIAAGLAAGIDPEAGYPAVFDRFPAENRVARSEAYITSDYLGHEFLSGVAKVDYAVGGKTYQAFVIEAPTEAAAGELLAKYYAFTRQSGAPRPGPQTIADRYNGDIPVLWRGNRLIGVFSPDGTPMPGAQELLERIGG